MQQLCSKLFHQMLIFYFCITTDQSRIICPKVVFLTVHVLQELWEVEELRDELFDVGHVVLGGREPGFAHAVEHPVSQVKMTSLVITQTPNDQM